MELVDRQGEPVLVSPLLGSIPGLRHGISTRWIHETEVPGRVPHRGRVPSGLGLFLAQIAWDGPPPFFLRQVHGAEVVRVVRDAPRWPSGDAAVTSMRGVLVAVRAADCLPVLLADVRGRGAAALHAGWRGVAAGVVEAGLAALRRETGADAEEILAAIGPGIGVCCFEVGGEVVEAVGCAGREDLVRPGPRGRPHLDLRGVVRGRLGRAGLPAASIDAEAPCTACRGDLFFSYRRQAGAAGRMVAAAGYALSIT